MTAPAAADAGRDTPAETTTPPPVPADRAAARADSRPARTDGRGKSAGHAAEAAANPIITANGQKPQAATSVPGQATAVDKPAQAELDAPGADAPADVDGTAQAHAAAPQAAASQAAPQGGRVDATTLPHLAAQIVKKLDAKVTQFDIALHPAGLGKVDVKVQIDRSGAITAALSFDNPQAVAELRGRADELKTALQQAGFDLSDAGLSFDLSGGQQRSAEDRQAMADAFAGRAFAAAADKAEDLQAAVASAAARLQQRGTSGIDIRI